MTIHPSGAGGPCPREIELSYLGHRDAVDSKSHRRMDNGTSTHKRWNKYLGDDLGVVVVAECRRTFTEPFLWSGECDVIIENPITGRRHVVELKSMNSFRWNKVPKQTDDRREMMRLMWDSEPHYARQLTQYIVKMQEEWGTDNEGIFIFENTDTQEFKVLYVEPDEAMREEAFTNAIVAQRAALEGRLIDPPFSRKSLTCRGCYRERLCYDLQDGKEDVCRIVADRLKETSSLPRPGASRKQTLQLIDF